MERVNGRLDGKEKKDRRKSVHVCMYVRLWECVDIVYIQQNQPEHEYLDQRSYYAHVKD